MKHVIFSSYGNDSIALIQWAIEAKIKSVTIAYSITGWAAPWWQARVSLAEEWAQKSGFETVSIKALGGMIALIRKKKAWPRNQLQFCTTELKIKPALAFLEERDPGKEAICLVGIRREESASRSQWPNWVESSPRHGGRALWSPLVAHTTEQRNQLIERAGFEPLPHRSAECYPCINSNRAQLRLLDEERIKLIEQLEKEMGTTGKGKPRVMFRPYRHQGATGIREVIRWANSEPGKYEALAGGCDSGMCGD